MKLYKPFIKYNPENKYVYKPCELPAEPIFGTIITILDHPNYDKLYRIMVRSNSMGFYWVNTTSENIKEVIEEQE